MAGSKKQKSEYITAKEFAQRVGVTPQTINRAIKTGKLQYRTLSNGSRRLYFPEALARYQGKTFQGEVNAQDAPTELTLHDVQKSYYAQKVRLIRLDFQKKSGKLVEVELVKDYVFHRSRTVRNALLALPDRIASVVTSLTPAEAHNLLTQEIEKVLENLSNAPSPF